MPPRFAVAGIVAFWLATTGYVIYRDVWPRVFASGPPPVTIELSDEARQNTPARWALKRNGEDVGRLTTQMRYLDAEDTFQFTYKFSQLEMKQSGIVVLVPEATSDVRMTRDGDLKEQSLSGKLEVYFGKAPRARRKLDDKDEPRPKPFGEATIRVRGVVTDGVLTGRGEISSSFGDLAGDLEPVPVKKGQPLNPLQPVNRIAGVTAGKRWVVNEYNPLQDALADLVRKQLAQQTGFKLPEPKAKDSLVAEVGGEPQTLTRRNEEFSCWVIEYRRKEGVIARTWVQVKDGKVMRQEATEGGESLVFERED